MKIFTKILFLTVLAAILTASGCQQYSHKSDDCLTEPPRQNRDIRAEAYM